MIFKLLAVIIVLILVYILFFKKKRESTINKKENEKIDDIMVECPKCKTFVSKKEAILSNGHYFCSKECLK